MKHQSIEQDVVVPALQNGLGGCGVAVLVGVGVVAIGGVGIVVALPWAAGAGLVVFGLASSVRAFRDEIAFLAARFGAARARASDERLRQQLALAQADLLAAQQRIREMETGAPPDADRMITLAWRVLEDHFVRGESLSYEACFARGACTRTEWDWLHTAFVACGIKRKNGQVRVDDLQVAWGMFGQQYAKGTSWIRTSNGKYLKSFTNGS